MGIDTVWDDELEALVWAARLDDDVDLLAVPPEELTPDRAVDYLVELQAAQARLAALEARALVVAAGAYVGIRDVTVLDRASDTERHLSVADEIRDELAAALRRAPGTVHDDLVVARLLAGPLARTRDALDAGRITARHVHAITREARRFDGFQVAVFQDRDDDSPADAAARRSFIASCHLLEDRILPVAESTTPQRTEAAARRAVAAIDAEGAERRRRQARIHIDVSIVPEDDGLALLLARLPLEDAIRIHATLDSRARSADDCTGTLGERRARALLDAVCGDGTAADRADTRADGARVEVQVVIDAAALLGLVDVPAVIASGPAAGTPLTAQAVRDLVADPETPTVLRRLVTDPVTGHLLDRGRRSYEVTDAMRAFLSVRDRTCRFPGCTRSAARCQVDHAIAWDDGGLTNLANTGPLCTRHHQLKTHGGWDITESHDDGSCRWRSPAGRTYAIPPAPVLDRPPSF